MRIVQKDGGHYRPLPLDKAVDKLKERWDDYFKADASVRKVSSSVSNARSRVPD